MHFLLSFATLLSLDQGLKLMANTHLRFNELRTVVPGILRFGRVLNRGLAWGWKADAPPGYLTVYTHTLPLLLWLAVCGLFFWSRKKNDPSLNVGFGLLIAGGFSNLITQWHCAGVLDTILIRVSESHYLPLNVADIGISIGAGLILLNLARLSVSFRHQ